MSGIALKITALLVRTVAKPVASTIKVQAQNHEAFKTICIRVAQALHTTDIKLRMSLLGENKIKVRPLNDKKAVDNGANFLLEAFIFLVAGLLILYESYRSRMKSQNEKLTVRNDILDLQEDIVQVRDLMERLASDIEVLTRTLAIVEAPLTKSPPSPPPSPATACT